jgi:hypothetical protein
VGQTHGVSRNHGIRNSSELKAFVAEHGVTFAFEDGTTASDTGRGGADISRDFHPSNAMIKQFP